MMVVPLNILSYCQIICSTATLYMEDWESVVACECARIPADTADKALGVVSASQSGDHFSCYEAVAAVTACTVQTLIVCCTDVLALLLEEARSCQVTVTHCRRNGREKVRESNSLKTIKHMELTVDKNMHRC